MAHDFRSFDDTSGGMLEYSLRHQRTWMTIQATTSGELMALPSDSVESFILEHYWGYTRQTNGMTSEYRVSHPSWRFWPAQSVSVSPDIALLYPPEFADPLSRAPHSVCVAQGSSVAVYGYRAFRAK
jgi:hypothetical protein